MKLGEGRRLLLASLALPFLAACGLPRPSNQRVKELPTPTPEPEIQPNDLQAILEALRQTHDPLLSMAANQIAYLSTTREKPSEYPHWVSANSVPLIITVSNLTTSQAQFSGKYKDDPGAKFSIKHLDRPERLLYQELESVDISRIRLAIPPSVAAGGSLAVGMYLASRHIAHMLLVKGSLEFYDVIHPGNVIIADKDGNPITDRRKQQLSGASFFIKEATLEGFDVNKIIKNLPVFLLSERFDSLIQRGLLPQTTSSLIPFYAARDILLRDSSGNLRSSLAVINGTWAGQGQLLPPDGTTLRGFAEPLYSPLKGFGG